MCVPVQGGYRWRLPVAISEVSVSPPVGGPPTAGGWTPLLTGFRQQAPFVVWPSGNHLVGTSSTDLVLSCDAFLSSCPLQSPKHPGLEPCYPQSIVTTLHFEEHATPALLLAKKVLDAVFWDSPTVRVPPLRCVLLRRQNPHRGSQKKLRDGSRWSPTLILSCPLPRLCSHGCLLLNSSRLVLPVRRVLNLGLSHSPFLP